jgi:tetratricopeptide (TPR) repeat protein
MATISEALAIAVRHHQAGRLQAAEQIYRQILAVEPDHADVIHLLGVIAHQAGKHDVAVEYIGRAIGLNGNAAAFHNNLGEAYRALRRIPEAIDSYRRALELKPDYAEARYNLGNALKDQGNLDDAIACYRRLLELKADHAAAYNNLGNALVDQGKLDEAIACFQQALKLKPDFAEAHNNLGGVLQETGDLQGAEDSLRAALRYNPRYALAHYKLAELLGGKLPQKHLAAQRRLLETMDLTDTERVFLHFGLARVLDARGEYTEAAGHLDRGKSLQRLECRKCGREYDPDEHEAFISRMIAACTPDFFERVHGFGLESELPVFVVGLPRSGTTLIEQILASHSQVFGAGEITLVRDTMTALGGQNADSIEGLRRLDRPTAGRLASRHLDRLRALNRTALRIVDKVPENYMYLGLLATLFPRSRLIHCRRDWRDVAVSCWMTLFHNPHWANDQQHIASRIHEYQRVMEHWRKVLPVPLLEVGYEETVANLEGMARKLVAWCGLPWEPACLEFHQARRPVRTASLVQVRQPVYRTSVGRWKHYERALPSLLASYSQEAERRAGRESTPGEARVVQESPPPPPQIDFRMK